MKAPLSGLIVFLSLKTDCKKGRNKANRMPVNKKKLNMRFCTTNLESEINKWIKSG